MNLNLFANNASSLLAAGITNAATSLSVTPTQGSLFPSPAAGQSFQVTVEDTSGNTEVMTCTGRSGDTLTVTRNTEPVSGYTPPYAFASGSRVELRTTAGGLTGIASIIGGFLQKAGGDTLSGTTTFTGVLAQGSSGSIQGGEFTGAHRGTPGATGNQIIVPVGGSAGPYIGGSSTNVILTATNLAANLPSGFDLIHSGMIVLWYGTSASIPTGWHLCDGTAGTPNLQDQFVIGGDTAGSYHGSYPANNTSGSYSAATGAAASAPDVINSYVLAVADIPAHQHPFDYSNANGTALIGDPGFSLPNAYIFQGTSPQTRVSYAGKSTGGGGGHSHTASSGGTHTHPQAIPYFAMFYIMKL